MSDTRDKPTHLEIIPLIYNQALDNPMPGMCIERENAHTLTNLICRAIIITGYSINYSRCLTFVKKIQNYPNMELEPT